jgi:beta-glucosidase
MVGSITRPVEELKGFKKVELAPGQSTTVSFQITPDLLKFYNGDLNYDWESGQFSIMIGPSSKEVQKQMVHWEK